MTARGTLLPYPYGTGAHFHCTQRHEYRTFANAMLRVVLERGWWPGTMVLVSFAVAVPWLLPPPHPNPDYSTHDWGWGFVRRSRAGRGGSRASRRPQVGVRHGGDLKVPERRGPVAPAS